MHLVAQVLDPLPSILQVQFTILLALAPRFGNPFRFSPQTIIDLLNSHLPCRSRALRVRPLRRQSLRGDSDDRRTAQGAIGVRSEPGIDTRDMESVVALRQQPESLVFLKLAQANRALRPFDQPLALLVLARRDGAYDRRRESDGADVPDRVVQDRPLVVVEELVVDDARLRLRPRRSPAPRPRPARIPPRVHRVAHDQDEERGEGGEEGDQERRQMVGPSSVRVQRGGFILRRTRRR